MNQGKIRTFIAISLKEAIIKEIELIQERLKKTKADVRWVKPANIHLTLKFLGHISRIEIDRLSGELKKTAQKFSPFTIVIEKIGAFPSLDNPRVIWVGIGRGGDLLKKINQAIENDLVKIGFPREERPFYAHLTLGRCRSAKHRDKLIKEIKKESIFFGELSADKISIYRSSLSSEGPVYSLLSEVSLGDTL